MKRIIVTFGFVMTAVVVGLLLADGQAGRKTNLLPRQPPRPSFPSSPRPMTCLTRLNSLISDAEKAVADKDEYDSQIENRFGRDADTISLVATALALHDQDNAVKTHAQAVVAAAGKLAMRRATRRRRRRLRTSRRRWTPLPLAIFIGARSLPSRA